MTVSLSHKKKKRKAIFRRSIKWDGENHVSRGSVTFLYCNEEKFVIRDKFTMLSRNKKFNLDYSQSKRDLILFLYQLHPACTTPDLMYTSPWSWGQQLSTEHRCENWGSGVQDGGIHCPSLEFQRWQSEVQVEVLTHHPHFFSRLFWALVALHLK